MEAICKADFHKLKKVNKDAEETLEQAKKEKKPTGGILVPYVGYHDIYGVWFFSLLKEIIRQFGTERFGVDLSELMQS